MKTQAHTRLNPLHLVEEAAGCLCPLLLMLSLVPTALLPAVAAGVCLWLGLGHSLLYYCNRMPVTRAAPVLRGVCALLAGLIWPLLLRR